MAEQNKTNAENTGFASGQTTGTAGGASARAAKENTSLTAKQTDAEETGTLSSVTNKVKGLYQTAAESQVGHAAKEALGQVKENATAAIDEKKSDLAHGLTSVAETIRQVGDNVKPSPGEPANKVTELTTQYADTLAEQVEKISGYLERQDLRAMMRDLENFARRNPALFLGGAFALGILAGRFLRSSGPKQLTQAAGQSFGAGRATNAGLRGGETSENLSGKSASDSYTEKIRQFDTELTETTGRGSTETGSAQNSSSRMTPAPSNKTKDDFGSAKF